MSHELRTPLAAILGYAELMQEGFYEPLGQKSLDALTRIRSNGKHLLGLMNTVLDIATRSSPASSPSIFPNTPRSVRSSCEDASPVSSPLLFLGDEQRLT